MGGGAAGRPVTSPTMVAILAATFAFYQEFEIKLKPLEMVIFLCFT